jgi:hypothetical protein
MSKNCIFVSTTFNKISALFESKKQKIKESRSANEVFELLGISLWDSKPQAKVCCSCPFQMLKIYKFQHEHILHW